MLEALLIKNAEKKLHKDLNDKSLDLENKLNQYREDVRVFESDSNLAKTIYWLIEKQNDNGSWGNDSVATTAIAMLALKKVVQPAQSWGYSDEIQKSFIAAKDFFIKRYKDNKFENAIWDTSVAIRALTACCPEESRVFINSKLMPLLRQSKTSEMNGGIHHLAQKILALSEFGTNGKVLEDCMIELQNFIVNNDWRKCSPYVISQCLEAMYIDEKKFNIDEIVSYLFDWLRNNSMDSANFINICSTLISIKPRLNNGLYNQLRYTVSSLFGPSCFRYDGSWYYDENMTSYAILSLAKYEKEILIRAPKAEFTYEVGVYIANVQKSFEEYQKNDTRNWIIHLLSTFIGTILFASFILYDGFADWAKWVIPVLGSSLLLFSFTEIILRIRRLKS